MFDLFVANKLDQSFKRNNFEAYNRKNLTEKLSELFDELST